MALKKNIFFNSLLTISNLVIPLLVFPYISRILGVANLGKFSFVDEVINYFILFATLGISTIGPREIAKIKQESQTVLNNIFSNIFRLHLITTFLVLLIFFFSIFFFPQLSTYYRLFLIGSAKIIFNLILVEWLFIGLENFKFVALRTIAVKVIFVISVFIFVKKPDDYTTYFYLSVASFVINAAINWLYALKFVKLKLFAPYIPSHTKSFLRFGLYRLLTSFYTSFNIIFLGFVSIDKEVGYYSTSVKIQSILLSLFTSYSAVLMPHSTTLITLKKDIEFKSLINKSFNILFGYCIPIIFIFFPLAPQIIYIFSGVGYEAAVPVIRIILLLIPIIGLELIFLNQVLLPLNMDKHILFLSIIGAATGLFLNLMIVKSLGSVGSAVTWLVSESVVLLIYIYIAFSKIKFNFPFIDFFKHILFSIPYIIICYTVKLFMSNNVLIITTALSLSIMYFLFSQFFIAGDLSFFKLIKNIDSNEKK